MKTFPIIRVISKLLIPYILLFGFYVQFHGDYGPGGGFQAGVILASAFILYGLVFGLDAVKRVAPPAVVERMMAVGILVYAGTGLVTIALGGKFLDYDVLEHHILHEFLPAGQHLGIFAVELGVGITVTAVMTTIFYAFTDRGENNPMSVDQVVGLYNYWIVIFLMMTGFYIVIARQNLIKVIIGLNIFQTSVFLLYITMGKIEGGTAPIIQTPAGELHHGESHPQLPEIADQAIEHGAEVAEHTAPLIYSNPLPSVLMLTAIVVGIATTALALALIVRVREEYGTIEEDQILELDRQS